MPALPGYGTFTAQEPHWRNRTRRYVNQRWHAAAGTDDLNDVVEGDNKTGDSLLDAAIAAQHTTISRHPELPVKKASVKTCLVL